jgi:hypothetical protein
MNIGIFSIGLINNASLQMPNVLFREVFIHPNFKTPQVYNYSTCDVSSSQILECLHLPETETKNIEGELQIFVKMAQYFKTPQIIALSMSIPKYPLQSISWEERSLLRALLGIKNPPYTPNYSELIDALVSPPEKLGNSSLWTR